jgi:hypothetical protein
MLRHNESNGSMGKSPMPGACLVIAQKPRLLEQKTGLRGFAISAAEFSYIFCLVPELMQ